MLGFGKLLLLGLGATGLYYVASSSTAKADTTGGGGGGGLSCDAALAALPADMRAAAVSVLTAPKTATTRAAALTMATSLEASATKGDITKAASSTTNAMRVVATCLRTYANSADIGGATPTGGVPGKDLLSCDAALAKLDPLMATTAKNMLALPANADTAKQLRALASSFEGSALLAPADAANALQVAATCLRNAADAMEAKGGGPTGGSTAGVLKDDDGVPSSWDGLSPQEGKASNPKYQWKHLVQTGESAFVIASQVFGSAGATYTRVIELIDNNPTEYYSGRSLGTVGDRNNPASTGFNFKSLLTGDVLKLPKSWNRWIDQMGYGAKSTIPYPNP